MAYRMDCLILLLLIAVLPIEQSQAQVVRRILNRRAAALAPPADPNAATATAVDPGAVAPAPAPLRGGFIARRLQFRRDLVAQQAAEVQPTPAAATPGQQALPQSFPQRFQALRQASALAAPAMRALTDVELSRMQVPELQTALSNKSGELSNELRRFSSANSWQGFLELPASILNEQTVDLADLQTALSRFENVARDPKFAQIAELPSFGQTRSLLTAMVNRVDIPNVSEGPQLIDPTGTADLSTAKSNAEESLPAPKPQLPRNEGEHSILVRTKKS